MKKIFASVMFLTALVAPMLARADEVTITVKGMVCSFCAQGIKKTFSREPGVTNVNVNLDTKLVTIVTDASSTLSDEKIRDSIRDAGYEVLEIKRKPNA